MSSNTLETLRLLVVSSEGSVLRLLGSTAQSNSWHLETSASGWDAMERVQSDNAPHLLLLDLPRSNGDGLHLLPWLRRLRPDLPIVVMCDSEDGAKQKEATRMGAKAVLIRPITEQQIQSVIRQQLGSSIGSAETEITSEDIETVGHDEFFLSVTPITQQLRAQAELLAQADVPVLILGEPGTGKATLARLIHQLSVYSGFDFLRVNCAEMPADLLEIELFGRDNGHSNSDKLASRTSLGKLELGHKGTLLLDEITQMPLSLQSKLVKVLHDKQFVRAGNPKPVEVDVRILATSSDKLDRALAEKRLDADLYYRFSAFTVHVPALRQRKDEIKLLLRYTMHKMAKHYGLPEREFTQSLLDACQNHAWPGNLKELETFVKRYLVAGDEQFSFGGLDLASKSTDSRVSVGHDLSGMRSNPTSSGSVHPGSLKSMIQSLRWETEKNAIAAALQKTGWNRKAAARLLGVSYRTILYKIEHYQMSAPETYFSSLAEARVASDAKGNGKAS